MKARTPGWRTRAGDDFLYDDVHRDSPDRAAPQDDGEPMHVSGYTLQFGDGPLVPCAEASEDDRAWFSRNVARNHRIRPPIGGEREAFKDGPRRLKPIMIVRQVEPGARIRVSAWATRRPLNSERLGRSLFDQIAADWQLCAKVEALARAGMI